MIREFFLDEKIGIPFHLFDMIHFGCLLTLIVSLYLIYRNRHKIQKIAIHKKNKIRLYMFVILFFNMFLYYGSYLYYGVYDIRVHLPLHFCFIAGILFMIYLITKWKNLYHIVFFLTFIGPLPAVIYPDLVSSFDSFIFYQYFISHHLLMIFSYGILYMDDHHITLNSAFWTYIWGNVIFITMMIVNFIFKTNYIMSNQLPEHIYTLFPVLRKINPVPILELVGITVVLLVYSLVFIKNKEDKYKNLQRKCKGVIE